MGSGKEAITKIQERCNKRLELKVKFKHLTQDNLKIWRQIENNHTIKSTSLTAMIQ